jgi:hypothetical protein
VNEACLCNALPVEAGTKAVAAPSSAKKHTALARLEEAITVNAQALSLLQVRRRDRRATVGTSTPKRRSFQRSSPICAGASLATCTVASATVCDHHVRPHPIAQMSCVCFLLLQHLIFSSSFHINNRATRMLFMPERLARPAVHSAAAASNKCGT